MKKSKKIAIILALVLIISLTAGCGGSTNDTPGSGTTTTSSDSAPVDKVYKIKFGGNMGVDSPISIYQQEIADYVNEKSGGRIEMTSYPASQLGDSTLMLEDMMNGTIQMCVFYTPNIYDDRYAINSFPYLVTNSEEFARICDKDSAFFKTYSAIHEEHNIKLLGIHADGLIGMNFTKYPENYNDVNARKSTVMRTPLVDAYKISMEKMGYPTTSVAWADLYSALQTGVCDGAVGATAITCYDNFRDVTKYWCAYNCFAEIAD